MSESDVKSYIPVNFDPFADAAASAVHFPMTEAQREVWASVQMGAEASNAYNVCHAFRVHGAFSMEAMKAIPARLRRLSTAMTSWAGLWGTRPIRDTSGWLAAARWCCGTRDRRRRAPIRSMRMRVVLPSR